MPPSSPMIKPGDPATSVYAVKELYDYYEEQGGLAAGFHHMFYVNDLSAIPQHFLLLEAVYIGLSLALLAHAASSQKLYLWAGFFGYGIVMETVGFAIQSHLHGQFFLHIFTFLPLKEVAWYPVFLYPPYVTASRIRFSSRWGKACMFGCLAILSDVAYEMSNGRQGVHVAYINPLCEASVLSLENRFLDASMSICMSVALLAATHSLVIDFIDDRRLPFIAKTMAIACAIPFQWLFFLPIAFAQAVFCRAEHCPHGSLLRPGTIFAFVMIVQLLVILNTIQHPLLAKATPMTLMCFTALAVNATCLYFLYISSEELSHRFDAACAIILVSILTCGLHCLGTRYNDPHVAGQKANDKKAL